MHRTIRAVAGGLIVVLVLLWGTVWLAREAPNSWAGVTVRRVAGLFATPATTASAGIAVPGGVQLGGPFHLVDDQGRDVTDATYRGRWMLVYFGYTTCPDVCPTELQTMVAALDRLGPEAASVVPLFITVDPERDTPSVLAGYVKLFDPGGGGPRVVGLTGTPQQIAAVAREYRVYYAKATPKGSSTYLMDHSSFMYLMDAQGRFSALFGQGSSAAELASGIQERLSQKS